MKANFINKDINTVSMTMEITAEEFEQAINKCYKEQKHLFRVNGFRKGKAPRKLIEAQYGSGIFYEDAINEVFNANYSDALEEIGYEPVDHPQIDLTDQEIESGKGFTFNIKFITEPEVEVENYTGVHVEVPIPEVTDDDMDTQLRSYARRNARLLHADKAAEEGDTVVLDYKGYDMDGIAFEGGSAEGHKLKIGSREFIPGFEEQLLGVKADDEKTIEVTFPIDYPTEKLAGELVKFDCKIHEVLEEELPEIDDDLAKECSEHDTLEEWKEEIRENIQKNKRQQNENRAQNEIIGKIYDETVIDIPECMIEHQIDELLRTFDQQLGYNGMTLDSYLEATHTDTEGFREQVRGEAEKKVKTRLIVEAIAKKEGLEPTEEDVKDEIAKMSVTYGVTPEKMTEIIGDDIKYVKKELAGRKALEFLVQKADIVEVEPKEPAPAGEDEPEASEPAEEEAESTEE